jgi:homoserine O-acetyltransferase/O-succinyltransferase
MLLQQRLPLAVILVTLSLPTGGRTQSLPPFKVEPTEGDYLIKNFRFRSGETLPELRLHYRTLGAPRRGPDGNIVNAALLLHGTTSSGKTYLSSGMANALFAPGAPLDVSQWFLIIPDNIGAGGSSKPSDGLHARFPAYGYTDLVEAQRRLVTEKLGVRHLRLVLGTSMGGMHSWIWAESYPEMMDAIVPIACQPAPISGRNLLWRRLITTAIRRDPEWKGGEYTAQPYGWLVTAPFFDMLTEGVGPLQSEVKTPDDATAWIDKALGETRSRFDANNVLYALEASRDYDPVPGLGRIRAKVLIVNFADDELNPPELGLVEQATKLIQPTPRVLLVPGTPSSHGHGNLRDAHLYREPLTRFLSTL